jgi:hypothetical protein
VVKAFDKFNALPLLTVIVPVLRVILAVAAEKEKAIVVNRNTAITVQDRADPPMVIDK